MRLKIHLLFVVIVAITTEAAVIGPTGLIPYSAGYHGHDIDYYAHPRYTYHYGVRDTLTGDSKSQTEYRDGDVVKGSYTVAEPDGSIRVVHYTADNANGFNAVVKKIGPSYHPQVHPSVALVPAPVASGHGYYGGAHGQFGRYVIDY